MKKLSPIFSAAAVALALCLALPPQVLALRVSAPQEDPKRQSGLEEALRQGPNSTVDFISRRISSVLTPVPIPLTGLEEGIAAAWIGRNVVFTTPLKKNEVFFEKEPIYEIELGYREVATSPNGEIRLYPLQGGIYAFVAAADEKEPRGLSGYHLIFADPQNKRFRELSSVRMASPSAILADPQGRFLAVAEEGRILLLDPGTGAVTDQLSTTLLFPQSLLGSQSSDQLWAKPAAVSPDGRWLLAFLSTEVFTAQYGRSFLDAMILYDLEDKGSRIPGALFFITPFGVQWSKPVYDSAASFLIAFEVNVTQGYSTLFRVDPRIPPDARKGGPFEGMADFSATNLFVQLIASGFRSAHPWPKLVQPGEVEVDKVTYYYTLPELPLEPKRDNGGNLLKVEVPRIPGGTGSSAQSGPPAAGLEEPSDGEIRQIARHLKSGSSSEKAAAVARMEELLLPVEDPAPFSPLVLQGSFLENVRVLSARGDAIARWMEKKELLEHRALRLFQAMDSQQVRSKADLEFPAYRAFETKWVERIWADNARLAGVRKFAVGFVAAMQSEFSDMDRVLREYHPEELGQITATIPLFERLSRQMESYIPVTEALLEVQQRVLEISLAELLSSLGLDSESGSSAGLEETEVQGRFGVLAAGIADPRGPALGVVVSGLRDPQGRSIPVVYLAQSLEQAAGLEELGVEKSSIFILGPALSLESALTAAEDWLRLTAGVGRVIRLGVDQKIPGVLEWLIQHLPRIGLSPQMAAGLEEWVEGAAQLLGNA